MRKLAANYIITGIGDILKNSYIELTEEGEIVKIVDTKGDLPEIAQLEFYNGVLIPGFVNAHAHLELSHLKNKLKQKKGLPFFIKELRNLRENISPEEKQKAISKADEEMYREGIVAVGDISNTNDSLLQKTKSKIKYITFVETYGIDKYEAHVFFDKAEETLKAPRKASLKSFITPHAPYSVSGKLFELITQKAYEENATLSIHNQETESENEMFISKKGDLVNTLSSFGIDLSNWYATGYNSLPSVLVQMPKCSKILLVHNTFSVDKDIKKTEQYTQYASWVLCPNANLYIENQLPDIELLRANKLNICIGTDSLASNNKLSILEELKTIQKYYPTIPFEELVQWACYNGAKALDIDLEKGSFEKGKKPGVNLIENFDFENFKLTKNSCIKRII